MKRLVTTFVFASLVGCGSGEMPGPSGSGGSGNGSENGGESAADAGSGVAGSASAEPTPFSFFVTSWAGLQRLSENEQGFGGDLSYDGHEGIEGADEICATLAEGSLPGARDKTWRAFLSTSSEDAVDRIGTGPWYDRLGRLVATDLDELLQERPGGDPAVAGDLPNEDGVANSSPEGQLVNNHDTLTGSDETGRLLIDPAVDSGFSTCDDWTSTEPDLEPPAVGHSWPAPSGTHWAFVGRHAAGCAALVSVTGADACEGRGVGCGGGYGGFYCFAQEP